LIPGHFDSHSGLGLVRVNIDELHKPVTICSGS
jgi:hypothetical protein